MRHLPYPFNDTDPEAARKARRAAIRATIEKLHAERDELREKLRQTQEDLESRLKDIGTYYRAMVENGEARDLARAENAKLKALLGAMHEELLSARNLLYAVSLTLDSTRMAVSGAALAARDASGKAAATGCGIPKSE